MKDVPDMAPPATAHAVSHVGAAPASQHNGPNVVAQPIAPTLYAILEVSVSLRTPYIPPPLPQLALLSNLLPGLQHIPGLPQPPVMVMRYCPGDSSSAPVSVPDAPSPSRTTNDSHVAMKTTFPSVVESILVGVHPLNLYPSAVRSGGVYDSPYVYVFFAGYSPCPLRLYVMSYVFGVHSATNSIGE